MKVNMTCPDLSTVRHRFRFKSEIINLFEHLRRVILKKSGLGPAIRGGNESAIAIWTRGEGDNGAATDAEVA